PCPFWRCACTSFSHFAADEQRKVEARLRSLGGTHMRKFAILLALMVGISGVARGQQTTGAITGRVADAQGLAVPGVNVTVTGAQGSRSTVTDSDGRYSIP